MANEKKGGIRYDDFVKIVKPDPGSTEQVVLLHGYVGASATDDKIRLYSDATLAEYADIAKADIVYSLPNDDDPLGGSRLWVKQSANVNYADAYAQGDMYNSYMNDQYTPGTGAMNADTMAGPATLACTIAPLTRTPVCRPTRFVCPTPVSRLVICTINPRTLGCPRPTLAACPQPSWVDACPSQWGCTIQTGTTVINPGGGAQFGADYAGGDVYNDYMQNSYEGGGENFGPLPTTLQTTVQPTVITTTVRPTIITTTRTIWSIPIWNCWRPTRTAPWCPPVTCQLGTIRPTTWPSIACATDITRTQTIQTGTTIINPGGGAQFDDYTGGDVYNDYMQNAYDGGATEAFGPAPVTSPQVCLQQVTNINCWPSSPIRCRFSVPVWRCITQQRHRSLCIPCQVTTTRTIQPTTIGTIRTTTFPSAVDGCPSQFGCATDFTRTNPTDVINPGGGQFNDYTGGDVYNDYMQNSYDGGATEAFGPGAATSPQICLQPVTLTTCQPSRLIICQHSVPVWRCLVTQTRIRSICRPCTIVTTTRTTTIQPTTIVTTRTTTFPSAVDGCPSQFGCATDITRTYPTDVINPGGGGGFYDYGY